MLFRYSNICIPDRDIFYAMGALRTYLQHTCYVFLIVALTVSVWKLIPLFLHVMPPQSPFPQLLIWIDLESGFIAEYSLDVEGK